MEAILITLKTFLFIYSFILMMYLTINYKLLSKVVKNLGTPDAAMFHNMNQQAIDRYNQLESKMLKQVKIICFLITLQLILS